MEFDPLENILSDSSNDSFFGGRTKVASKSTHSLAESTGGRKCDSGVKSTSSKSLSKEKAVDSNILTGSSHKASPIKIASTLIKTVHGTLINAKQSELINDLGFDPKKPKTGKVDRSNLFGELEAEKFSRQSTETTESFTPGTYTKLRQKTFTNKQFTSSLDDPLGFFTSSKEKQELNPPSKDNKDLQKLPVKLVDGGNPVSAQDKEVSFGIISVAGDGANHDLISLSKSAKSGPLESGTVELQNSLHALRLEEARLLLAAQMKMQQQLLLEMKKKQDAVFLHQETQFNNMLKKQALHKNELENTIRMQEERVRLQVQTLFAVPTLDVDTSFRNSLLENEETMHNVGMVNFNDELNKLKEENQRLGNFLTSLSDNHRKELELVEQTYKDHIKLLEKNLHELAVQSKEDEENSELSIRERRFAETESVELLECYDKKLKDIEEQHDASVANLRKHYDAEIEILRKDYKWMNENISNQCKCSESVAKQNNESLQALGVAFADLKDLAKYLREVLNEIHSATRKELNQREEKLITREKQIEGIEQRLQLLDESSQAEHKKILDLVRSLETLLKNLTEGHAKEKVDLLHAERLALNRDRELFLEFIEKKENRIQESQKLHEAEKTVLMRQIQEEWRLLNKERKKLSTKMECDKTLHFDLASDIEDSTDSKVRIDNEKERGIPIPNALKSESCANVKEPQYWEKIKDQFLKGIQHLRIVELQVHESLQRTELAEKRFNCTIQTLKEQMKHMTVRDARLSKGRAELAQGHLQLRSAASKDSNNICRYCKTVFGTQHEDFESKLWVDSFFNVHDTADHLKYLDCYIQNSNGSKIL